MIDKSELPPAYFSHPVVSESDSLVAPYSVFIDGLPYSVRDSMIVYWITNEVTKQRHLWAAVRKSIICSCGCRGRCAHYQMFAILKWG